MKSGIAVAVGVVRAAFISLAVVGILVSPRPLGAQPGKPRVVGYLTPAPPGVVAFHQFRQALRDIGYVDGQDILVEERSARGDLSRLPHLAAELVSMRVDIIVAVANEAIRAAKDATATIPIVMRFSSDDPVINGFVKSYQRPGGNVTGLTILASALGAKRVELLRELIPGLGRIAVLLNPARAWYHLRETQAAARSLGVHLYVPGGSITGLSDFPGVVVKRLEILKEVAPSMSQVAVIVNPTNLSNPPPACTDPGCGPAIGGEPSRLRGHTKRRDRPCVQGDHRGTCRRVGVHCRSAAG